MRRILIIRLGALGDFVLSFAPFAAIRSHHPGALVTLLTTPPFAGLAAHAPWFDRVLVDERPAWWDVPGLIQLARRLRGFDFVYDLQTSGRSSRYFLLAGFPPWSGIAPFCSHPHTNPNRTRMHTLERQRDQLAAAGIHDLARPDLSWIKGASFDLPTPYALLVPGAALHRPRKRWPAAHFADLAQRLAARGLTPVVVGGMAEQTLARGIRSACPQTIDLTGRTAIADIATLARRARLAIGNDTGPMHLAAAVGCRCIVLFSDDSDPDRTAPRGPGGEWPIVLREPDLADLPVDRVAAALP